LLFYDVAADYLARRAELREVDGAVLLFAGDSLRVAEAFARDDP
jgi:hypothetical protein